MPTLLLMIFIRNFLHAIRIHIDLLTLLRRLTFCVVEDFNLLYICYAYSTEEIFLKDILEILKRSLLDLYETLKSTVRG